MVWAAHSTKFWRRNFGHCRRQWTQLFFPLRSITGAMPAYFFNSSAVPKTPAAHRWQQASTGLAGDQHRAGSRTAHSRAACSYLRDLPIELHDRSQHGAARSYATSASKCRRHGPIIAGSSVTAAAARMDSMRTLIRLALRQWCASKDRSRTAVRACRTERSVGQRSRKSQNNTVPRSSNHFTLSAVWMTVLSVPRNGG